MIKATVPRERALKDEENIKAILKFTRVNIRSVKEKQERTAHLLFLRKE
jgi:hypothetical protein